jgi:hypothetical protein
VSDEEHFHASGTPWPLGSPNLTVPDFFLWGYFKNGYTGTAPHTIEEMKRPVWDEIAIINQEMLRRSFDNFVNCLRQCVADEGGSLQDDVFQKE